jgi:hypothetical protein
MQAEVRLSVRRAAVVVFLREVVTTWGLLLFWPVLKRALKDDGTSCARWTQGGRSGVFSS